jgi:hypothetical protein
MLEVLRSYNGVRMPIALTTHQPARASKIAKAPPNTAPAVLSHQKDPSRTPVRRSPARTNPPNKEAMPPAKRAAFPLASMLHSNAMALNFLQEYMNCCFYFLHFIRLNDQFSERIASTSGPNVAP